MPETGTTSSMDLSGLASAGADAAQPAAPPESAAVPVAAPAPTPAPVVSAAAPGADYPAPPATPQSPRSSLDTFAANPEPPARPGPHARLLAMVQGLALGMDAFAKSAATGGREGGVEEVQAVRAQEQEQQIRAQAA